jgi:predicted DNA-binding mobile mystery protein A
MSNRAITSQLRRRQLDKTFLALGESVAGLGRPRGGWIRAIREALGMTTGQLAARLGMTQPAVIHLEKSEASGGISLKTLTKAAAALDCHLVYVLVPNSSLESQLEKQAHKAAQLLVERVAHTMTREAQESSEEEYRRQIEELAHDYVRTMDRQIWRSGPTGV